MNKIIFAGRLASNPEQSGMGDRAVVKFTLIRNDYAGKDDDGAAKEKKVAIQFTAFRAKGEAIAKHCWKGDQL
ncbi:MAG: single-stranded DNA-binding protein, partial [Burkholderiales bacterium]